jgi:TRAP-type C4-dicarboxylate transport system permease small subunit
VPAEPGRLIIRVQTALAASLRLVDRALFLAATIIFLAMIVALFLQVWFRYVLEAPLPWSEESARFMLVWLSMLGACIATREGQHFLFRWFALFLPGEARFWLRRLCDLLAIAILVVIFRYSLVYLDIVAHQTAPGTGLNMRVPYAAVSVGMGILIYIYVCETIDCLLSKLTGQMFTRREAVEREVAEMFRKGGGAPLEGQ